MAEVARTGRDPLGITARQPWEIPAAGWWRVIKRTAAEIGRDNVGLLAAGVAFYVFLAFVPLLASVVLAYGLIADPQDVARQLGGFLAQLPADAAAIITDQLAAITTAAPTRTGLGLLTALALSIYGATRGAGAIITATNIAYEQADTRGFVRGTVLNLAMTSGVVLLIVAVVLANGAVGWLGRWLALSPALAGVAQLGASLVALGLFVALLAVIYRVAPDRHDARWTWLLPGALVATIGIVAGSVAFGAYVSRFGSYNATYGALGAVVSFLMWLYLTAYVLICGAELNAELERQTARDTTTGPETPLGTRRAKMADTVAVGETAPPDSAREAQAVAAAATKD